MKKIIKIFIAMIFLMVAVVLAIFVNQVAYGQTAEQCPDGWIAKYESSAEGVTISGATVTFDTERTFCVKAATKNSGILTGTTFTVNWLNESGQIPDISHVVVYNDPNTPTTVVTTETPEDTPTPVVTTETPEDTPTPVSTLRPPDGDNGQERLMLPVSGIDQRPFWIQVWDFIKYKIFKIAY